MTAFDPGAEQLAAVRLDGAIVGLAFDGATNTACFEAYVGECLVPTLRPGDIVVMDNLGSHKGAAVRAAPAGRPLAAAGRCGSRQARCQVAPGGSAASSPPCCGAWSGTVRSHRRSPRC